jgi:hypothetical protein
LLWAYHVRTIVDGGERKVVPPRTTAWHRPDFEERDVSVISPTKFKDHEWRRICAWTALPIEAQLELEQAVDEYKRRRACNWRPVDVRANLKMLAREARKFAALAGRMGRQERMELAEFGAYLELGEINPVKLLDLVRKQAATLGDNCEASADQITERKKPGKDPRDVQLLTRALDDILRKYTKTGISRSKRSLSFAVEVFKIADPNVGCGSIQEAIRAVQRLRRN